MTALVHLRGPIGHAVVHVLRAAHCSLLESAQHPDAGPRGTEACAAAAEPVTPASQLPSDSFWARIKRHKVVEWTLAYVAFGYALLHGVQMLRETFDWPFLLPRLAVPVISPSAQPTAATPYAQARLILDLSPIWALQGSPQYQLEFARMESTHEGVHVTASVGGIL